MRVVLTGASGQLGSYLATRLVRGGHEVHAWSGTATGARGGVVLRGVDLTDEGATLRALDKADPAGVIHLAGVSSAEAVRLDPARARLVNVEATARLADWCSRRGRR